MKKHIFIILLSVCFTACNSETKINDNTFFIKENVETDPIIILTDSLRKNPKNIRLWIQKAEICKEISNFSCALDAAAKAFNLDSTNIEARKLYGWSLINKINVPVIDIERAKRHFQYVLSIQPNNPENLVNLANTFSLTGDFKTAIKYVNDALKIDEYYRDAYVLKGSIYKITGKNEIALSSYQTALQIDPAFFMGQLNTAWLLTEMENHQLALEYYRNAKDLEPENINAIYGIAKSLQDLEKYNEALIEYREIEKIDPNFYYTYFNQGYIKQYYQNELDSAAYFYELVLNKNPKYIGAWYQLGETYFKQARYPEAAGAFAEALKINNDYKPAKEAAEKLRKVQIK